jgi:hypothetical protein
MGIAALTVASLVSAASMGTVNQDWEYEAAYEMVSGIPRGASATDALFIFDDAMVHVDVGPDLPEPVQVLGTAKLRVSQPVDWFERQLVLVPTEDPAKNPAAPLVPVIVSVNAAIYEVTNEVGSREISRLELRADVVGPEGGGIIIVDPWVIDEFLPTDGRPGTIGGLLDRLVRGGRLIATNPQPNPNINPECVRACERDYRTTIDNLIDRVQTEFDACLNDDVLGGTGIGCVTGAGFGAALTALPTLGIGTLPAAGIGCGIGGLIGFIDGMWGCYGTRSDQRDLGLREADRDLLNCLSDCGVVVQ